MADKLGASKCDCGEGGTVEWTLMKNHGASGKCLDCGEQRFKRSPKAVEALKRQLAGSAPPPKKKDDDGTNGAKGGGLLGEPLDLNKL